MFKMTRETYNFLKDVEDFMEEKIVEALPEAATYCGTSPNGWESWKGVSGQMYSIYTGEWA